MFAIAAVDDGPRLSLEPLAMYLGIPMPGPREIPDVGRWRTYLATGEVRGLVSGTSNSLQGVAFEADARSAATNLRLPVVVLEDYPGNYRSVDGARTSLLIVESVAAAEIARARLGPALPRTEALSSVRYDALRLRAGTLRQRTHSRWKDDGASKRILWAGQPEVEDAQRALDIVVPVAARLGATVLFKAHPRDKGYHAGAYGGILDQSGGCVVDITALSVPQALQLAPHVVVTQYSSVAIDAGFYGIPGLHLLLADAGGARLLETKGYTVPPHASVGAAVVVSDAFLFESTLVALCRQPDHRDEIINTFDRYFETGGVMLPRLVGVLASVFES